LCLGIQMGNTVEDIKERPAMNGNK